MENKPVLPFYLAIAQILTGIIAFIFILYIGKAIILPILFALVLAILLNPVVNFLHRKGIHRVLAIFIALLSAIIIVVGLVYFISSQAALFTDTYPALKQKLNIMFAQSIQWITERFNISTAKIDGWIDDIKTEGFSMGSGLLGQTLATLGGALVVVFLLPVYIFMILFYKPLLLDFIAQLFPKSRHKAVTEVLGQTKSLIQNYLAGLVIEAVIVAILNATGLLILGIQYAILLGIIGAILNVIPYIGGVIAISLPMIIAFATKSPLAAVYVLIAYTIVQFIDNHYIVPYIVASKVKLNALISIVAVLAGGALWGVPGMFLSIPLFAIVKVIFDHIEPLKPFGFLLGDTMPQIGKSIFNFSKKKKV